MVNYCVNYNDEDDEDDDSDSILGDVLSPLSNIIDYLKNISIKLFFIV